MAKLIGYETLDIKDFVVERVAAIEKQIKKRLRKAKWTGHMGWRYKR